MDEQRTLKEGERRGGAPYPFHFAWIVLYLVLGALLLVLLLRHQAHVFGLLPYLLILACPLMHLLHHRHHARHSGAHRADR